MQRPGIIFLLSIVLGALFSALVYRYLREQQTAVDSERASTPEAIRLWRVLVATNEEARRIIAEFVPVATIERWAGTAREHSLDAATKQLRGDLGFVAEGGQRLGAPSVDPALFRAAARVSDGAIVGDPVPEGERFAVVWRRGTRSASQQGNEARTSPREALIARQVEAAKAELRATLRAQYLHDHTPERLEQFEWPTTAELELLLGLGGAIP
jgi:peptidyl-prolyl cis-trans isomerase C